jgi:HSP20 family protein
MNFQSQEKSNTGSMHSNSKDSDPSLELKPRFEVRESKESFVLLGTMPGLRKDEMSVELIHGSDGCVLEVTGVSVPLAADADAPASGGGTMSIGGEYARFERRVRLPHDAETGATLARYKDGLLTVTVPRRQKDPPRREKVEIL